MTYIKEEIVNAVNYYKCHSESLTKVAKKFGIDRHVLSKYLKMELTEIPYDPKFSSYVIFTEAENNAVQKYLNGEYPSAHHAAKALRVHIEKFRRICSYKGIETSNAVYKHTFNRDALKEIKTEEDAYLLGYITADGYVCASRNTVRLKTKAEDEDILHKINKYLDSDYDVKYETHNITGNTLSRLSFHDKDFVDTLISYGLIQGKSGKEIFIKSIPNHLMRHYIRGLFDGDGYILKIGKGTGLCGSYDVLANTRAFLLEALDLNVGDKYPVRYAQNQHVHKLAFSGDTAVKIIKYLYQDSNIYLDRKYNLAKRFFDEKQVFY